MTLYSMSPVRVDMPVQIVRLLEQLQGFLEGREAQCSDVITLNIWRMLEIWEHMNYDVHDHDREHDIAGRGATYERKKEATKLSWAAFKSVFGNADFKKVKNCALRAALCEASRNPCPVEVTPEEVEEGKKFFKAWYDEAKKYEATASLCAE